MSSFQILISSESNYISDCDCSNASQNFRKPFQSGQIIYNISPPPLWSVFCKDFGGPISRNISFPGRFGSRFRTDTVPARDPGIHSWNFISGGILEIRKSGVEATWRQKEIHSRILYHDDDSKARSGLFPHLMAFQKDR